MDLFRILAEHIPGVVYLCANDATYTMKYLNDRVEELTGIPASRFLAGEVSFVSLYHPDDAEAIGPLVDAALAERRPFRLEYRLRHADGSWRWVEEHGQGVFDEAGELRFLEGTLFDVSERVEAHARHRDLETKLATAQKLELIGLLVGGIAHDFNNVLLSIMGNIELAKIELDQGDTRVAGGLLDDALEATNHAADLTRQLLVYAGQDKHKQASFTLERFIESMRRLLQTSVAKTTELRFDYGEAATLQLDQGLLQQAVLNLVLNADDAIGGEAGSITLRTGCVSLDVEGGKAITIPGSLAPGRYAWFEVQDDGSGMSPETAARIFEPFFSTKSTGHGLGMATLLGVLETYRGGLQLDTTLGQGTRFRLLFPVRELLPSDANQGPRGPAPPSPEGPVRILVVDDERRVRRMIREVLGSAGHEVLEAHDWASGCAMLEAEAPHLDLVIFDVNLPDGSGIDLYSRLRELAPDTPVLFSSGFVRPELVDNDSLSFLAKPYRPQLLADRVAQLLGRN